MTVRLERLINEAVDTDPIFRRQNKEAIKRALIRAAKDLIAANTLTEAQIKAKVIEWLNGIRE